VNPGALKVSPTPTTIDLGEAELPTLAGPRRFIVVSISALTGLQVYFLSPADARALGAELSRIAASDVLFTTPQGAPV
jgi:hypothetical protein